jgi:effector-binding domain-containing protein
MANQVCEYTSGFGYKTQVSCENLDNTVAGHVEKHQALRVDHYGPYRHLGNAWTTAQNMLRSDRKKSSKTIPMYEIYGNFPGEVDEKDILTKIHIPLR